MKNKILILCKAIGVSTVLSFVCFFVTNIFVRAIFENTENINLILYCVNMITYSLFFYFIRTRKLEDIISINNKFNLVSEAKTYFFSEGKYLLYIYSVLAIICEVNAIIVPKGTGVIFATLCSMCFPFFSIIRMPVLRLIINILLANIIPLLLFECYAYSIKKYK